MWVAMLAESSVPSRKGEKCAKPFRELQFLMTRAHGGLGERWKHRDGQRALFMETQELFGEGNGNPTPVFLPGESQGRGSLVGCHLWGRTESDTTKVT